jgi:hypothetical protein
MWKRVMGNKVFNATAAAGTALDPMVRVHGHCGLPPSPVSSQASAVACDCWA